MIADTANCPRCGWLANPSLDRVCAICHTQIGPHEPKDDLGPPGSPGDGLTAEIGRVVAALHREVGAVGREAHLIGAVNVYRTAFHEMTRKWCGIEIDPSLTGIEGLLVAMLRAW